MLISDAAVVGAGSLLIRVPARAFLVLLPIPLTLAAAALGQYPLTYRTTLFLVPVVVLTLAEGIARLTAWTPRRWAPIIAVGLSAAIAAGPAWWSANAALNPPGHEEIKPVLTHIGAGDGNRTRVISLEGWSSTIELLPLGSTTFTLQNLLPWWRRLDSNQRTR